MKIVNEKGKLFGIINIVDLVVILLVVAIIAALCVKLLGNKVTDVVAPKVPCYAEIVVIGANPRLLEEVERQNLRGERMVSGSEFLSATIEDFWFQDYLIDVQCADGSIVVSKSPDKKDIYFLVKTEVAADTASPKIGSQELRAGRTFIIKAQKFETTGTIKRVDIGEYSGNGNLQ